MPLVDALLPEFDHEMTVTRKLLERVPDDKLAWKPHAKSYSLGQLAQHVATIPMWGSVTLSESEIDIAARRLRRRPAAAPRSCRSSTVTSPRLAPRSSASPTAS
jgi:hypothetical protein